MDWLTFLSNVIASLAWPATIAGMIFFVFKKRLTIMQIIKSIRFKDFEFILRDDLEKAKELSDEIKADHNFSQVDDPTSTEHVISLAKIDPGVAVLRSWQRLEAEIIRSIRHNGLMRYTNPQKFMERLFQLGKLNKDETELYQRLKKIRNEIVHFTSYGFLRSPTTAVAVEYDDLVQTMIQKLESIRQQDGYIDLERYPNEPSLDDATS